jgi:hypothetical protein
VSTPKIGSRAGLFCFGGILGNHAVLRRELFGGNLFLVVFSVLGGSPRGSIEEGGTTVCFWGNLIVFGWGFVQS